MKNLYANLCIAVALFGLVKAFATSPSAACLMIGATAFFFAAVYLLIPD